MLSSEGTGVGEGLQSPRHEKRKMGHEHQQIHKVHSDVKTKRDLTAETKAIREYIQSFLALRDHLREQQTKVCGMEKK